MACSKLRPHVRFSPICGTEQAHVGAAADAHAQAPRRLRLDRQRVGSKPAERLYTGEPLSHVGIAAKFPCPADIETIGPRGKSQIPPVRSNSQPRTSTGYPLLPARQPKATTEVTVPSVRPPEVSPDSVRAGQLVQLQQHLEVELLQPGPGGIPLLGPDLAESGEECHFGGV